MVDASVGGKVAVDLPQGKNLVGAFKAPTLVLADPLLLRTLPGIEFRCGLAEVAKAAVIGDPALFEQLSGNGPQSLTFMIADAVRVKIGDRLARPVRVRRTRCGSTSGTPSGMHSRLTSGLGLRHGEAVALGMIAAAEMSSALGYCDHTLPVRIRRLIERLGLPLAAAFDPAEAAAVMGTDKKRRAGGHRFVLPRRIGQVEVVSDVPSDVVRVAWETIRAPSVGRESLVANCWSCMDPI